MIGNRIWAIQSKYTPGFDDIGVQLIISGRGLEIQHLFNQKAQTQQRITAKYLRQITQLSKAWHIDGVSKMIKGRENHPPLFFWIAHIWCSIFGFTFLALYALQGVFEILLVFALLSLIKKLTPNSLMIGIISIAVLLVHPSAVDSLICPRNYHLLALFTVLLFRQFTVNSARTNLWIIPISIAGSLTHFYFPVITIALVLAFAISERVSKQFIIKLLFLLFGFLISFILFKDYFFKLINSANSIGSINAAGHSDWLMALAAPLRLLIPWRLIREIPIVLAALIWPILFIIYLPKREKSQGQIAITFGILLLFILSILLVLGKVPFHSFTENRYLLIVTCLFIPFFSQKLMKQKKISPNIIACLLILYFSILSAFYFKPPMAETIKQQKIVVVAKYSIDAYQAAYALQDDQKICLVKNPNDLYDLELENSLILWKRFDATNPDHVKAKFDLDLKKSVSHYYINSFEKLLP